MTKCSEASAISYCCCALILLPEAGVVRAMQPFIFDHGGAEGSFGSLGGTSSARLPRFGGRPCAGATVNRRCCGDAWE